MTDGRSQKELEEMAGHPLRRSTDVKSFNDISLTVGRLEQSIENTSLALRDHAQQTNAIIDRLTEQTNANIDRLTRSVEELTRNQLLGKQTNWGMIASWAAVLVLLLGLVVYQPLQELRTGINAHKQDGHPTSVLQRVDESLKAHYAEMEEYEVWQTRIDAWILEKEGKIKGMEERVLDLEREAYPGAAYRAGRPIKPANPEHQ